MRPRYTLLVISTLALILPLGVTGPSAQSPMGPVRDLLDQASLHRLIDGDPPVTTDLEDALMAIDFLDRYRPSAFVPLSAQPQDAAGAFLVGPGAYDFGAESYCLHAGTHGPGGGDGYVYAPLQGSKDAVVRHILQNAVAHPEIPQQDIQVLLWAILARTRIGEMPRKTQVTAARLLTPAQLLDLNGGALGMVPGHAWREATQSLPPSLLRTFEAEARLRQLLSTIDASYDEIERLAVLNGNPAPDPASRQIPAGRWSYHPAGYFIRFFPSGYSRSEVQIYVPEPVTLVRDPGGRITAIDDPSGARVEVDYTADAAATRSDSDVQGHAFQSVHIPQADVQGPGYRVAVNGWTLVGVPRGVGQASGNQTFGGWNDRYRAARQDADAWRRLLDEPTLVGAHGGYGAPRDLRDLVGLAQLQQALQAAFNATGEREMSGRLSPVTELVAKAWAAAFCEQAGGCVHGGRSVTARTPVTVDLSETVAVPGHRGRQRLGMSGRSSR